MLRLLKGFKMAFFGVVFSLGRLPFGGWVGGVFKIARIFGNYSGRGIDDTDFLDEHETTFGGRRESQSNESTPKRRRKSPTDITDLHRFISFLNICMK